MFEKPGIYALRALYVIPENLD